MALKYALHITIISYNKFTSFVHSDVAPEPQHPHPAAPAEFKEHFSSFLAKFKASAMRDPQSVAPSAAAPKNAAKSNVQFIEDPTQLPARLRSPDLTEAEIEAITVSSACVFRASDRH